MKLKENFKQFGIYRKDEYVIVVFGRNRKNLICFRYILADSELSTNQEINFLFKHCSIDSDKLIYIPINVSSDYTKDFAYLGQLDEDVAKRLDLCYTILTA